MLQHTSNASKGVIAEGGAEKGKNWYEKITTAVAEKLEAGVPVERLMGGPTDTLKLASSLTLFHAAASQLGDEASDALARRCDAILRITALQGYPACSLTAKQLSSSGR